MEMFDIVKTATYCINRRKDDKYPCDRCPMEENSECQNYIIAKLLKLLSERVKITRCKDCIYADPYVNPDEFGRYGICDKEQRIIPYADYYCAEGTSEMPKLNI